MICFFVGLLMDGGKNLMSLLELIGLPDYSDVMYGAHTLFVCKNTD